MSRWVSEVLGANGLTPSRHAPSGLSGQAGVRWPSEAFRWPQDGPRGVQENPKTALRQFFFSFGGIGTKSALHLAGTRQRAKCAASVNNQNEETEIFCITKQWKYSTEIFCITRPWKSSTEIFCITRPWKSSTEIRPSLGNAMGQFRFK